jgi:hypothetical protein
MATAALSLSGLARAIASANDTPSRNSITR